MERPASTAPGALTWRAEKEQPPLSLFVVVLVLLVEPPVPDVEPPVPDVEPPVPLPLSMHRRQSYVTEPLGDARVHELCVQTPGLSAFCPALLHASPAFVHESRGGTSAWASSVDRRMIEARQRPRRVYLILALLTGIAPWLKPVRSVGLRHAPVPGFTASGSAKSSHRR